MLFAGLDRTSVFLDFFLILFLAFVVGVGRDLVTLIHFLEAGSLALGL